MHTPEQIPPALLDLAAEQDRVLTVEQIRQHGLSERVVDRLVRTGVWRRMDRSLVLVTNSPPILRNYLSAAFLLIPGGLACGRTALAMHGLGQAQLPIEITHPKPTHLSHRTWLKFRRIAYDAGHATTVDDHPIVGTVDSVVSACYSLPRRDAVEVAMRAVALRICQASDLLEAVQSRPRLPHRATLIAVLTDAVSGLHSQLEVEHDRRVRVPHRLPTPELQYKLTTGKVVDAAFPEYRVLIELDGRLVHSDKRSADRRRDNRHWIKGWITLRFGWYDVLLDPCGVAADIANALTEHDWPGTLRPCVGCATAG